MSYSPGTASLLDELDKKLMVLLRDGRTLIGYLRSVDQFANLVLHRTIERIHVGRQYGDIPRGVFIVRGENVVLLGEINQLKSPCAHSNYSPHSQYPNKATFTVTPSNPRQLSPLRNPTDPLKEDATPLIQVSVDDILDAQRREQEAKQDQERLLAKALKERGLNYAPDLTHDDLF
ncbi:unnamed protein product [Timema podura]|uniref:U6 snRNA-associated Sm-like protein LSm1 n=1 Tax=Timema podura TaxID=61482 RepID=A0ABN7NML9_TIMPD|nr:unnamed protein product [Timema podura]